MSVSSRVLYFEGVVERAVNKLHSLPKKASGATRLLAEKRYAYAVRCYDKAITGKKWLPRPEAEVVEED